MEQFILKGVLFATKEATGDFSQERKYPCILKYSWMSDKNERGKLIFSDTNIRTPTQQQHLYIVSDDKINKGDWFSTENGAAFRCMSSNESTIYYCKGNDRCSHAIPVTACKRLHYATDTSLNIGKVLEEQIPYPPKDVIERFILAYNKEEGEEDAPGARYEVISKGKEGFPEDTISWWVGPSKSEKRYSAVEVLEHLNLLCRMKSSTVDTFTDKNDYITEKWFEQFRDTPKEETTETHDYILSFINQFTDGHLMNELSDKEWTVSRFLLWLEANNFKITKHNGK